MKIASWNVNGIRSIQKHSFRSWFVKSKLDVLCIQETKAQEDQLAWDIKNIGNYKMFMNSAEKKGYSGTAIYTKTEPNNTIKNIGMERFDNEGRMIRVDFPKFTLINIYVPNGGRNKENINYKLDFYRHLFKYLEKIKDKKIVLTGDFNIAHKEMDLARPKENMNNIMFTPKEREQIDKLIKLGFTDTFRMFNSNSGHYSWWAYFRNARERNIGWRIDYIFVSNNLKNNIKNAYILKDVKGSDHCPVGIDISI